MRRQRLVDQRDTDRIDRSRDAARIIPVLFRAASLLQNSQKTLQLVAAAKRRPDHVSRQIDIHVRLTPVQKSRGRDSQGTCRHRRRKVGDPKPRWLEAFSERPRVQQRVFSWLPSNGPTNSDDRKGTAALVVDRQVAVSIPAQRRPFANKDAYILHCRRRRLPYLPRCPALRSARPIERW